MLIMLAVVAVIIFGAALLLFGLIAGAIGLFWILWPLMTIIFILVAIGYRAGKRKRRRIEETEETK